MNLNFKINDDIVINDFLLNHLFLSNRLKHKLIVNKNILINGIFVDTRNTTHSGDIFTIILDTPPEDNSNITPTKMPLDIIYEDAHILIVNKSAGIAIHPSILHFDNTLSNGIKYYYDEIGLHKKIRIVNRIDLNTSGLVLIAKNEYIQECLIKQMKEKTFKKTYVALVQGHMPLNNGTIDAPIARKDDSIIERCVSPTGKPAITHYKILKVFEDYSLIECQLETGRTHQIRVHMEHVGAPLLGDSLYNTKGTSLIKRQALHSYKMEFIHPVLNKLISIAAPLPKDMEDLILK